MQLSNAEIRKYYYDPFVKNEGIVRKNLEQIEIMTEKKILELNEIYHSIDHRQKILQDLAIDLVEVKQQISKKQKEKLEL